MSTLTKDSPREEVQEEWLRRLESGEYKQGVPGILRDCNGGYCCLGVAMEMATEVGMVERGEFGYRCPGSGAVFEETLTPRVRDWLGMASELGNHWTGELAALSDMNDGTDRQERSTFAEIAAHVRKHRDDYLMK